MFEKMMEISMLFDLYGQLLTIKQREILHLYYEDNYTLAEIAEEMKVTRQAVYDTVKKSEKTLQEYEENLGLAKKFHDTEIAIDKINKLIDQALDINKQDINLQDELKKIKSITNALND
jgi:predicted DNA-binding protein YlxM (UPF0122 family)